MFKWYDCKNNNLNQIKHIPVLQFQLMNIDFYLYCYRAILSCCMFGTPTIFLSAVLCDIYYTRWCYTKEMFIKCFNITKILENNILSFRQSEFMVCAEDYSLFIRLDWLFWGMRFKKKGLARLVRCFDACILAIILAFCLNRISVNYWLKYTNSYNTRQ